MKTFPGFFAASCGLAIMCFSGLVARAQDTAANYWPLKVGSTWTIETKVNDRTISEILTVTKVTPAGGSASDACIEYKVDGKVAQIEIYRFDDKGISRVAGGSDGSSTYTPVFPLIQYPLADGSKWTWTGTFVANGQTFQATADLSASGPETVPTPAGEFKAMRIHSELTIIAPGGEKMQIPNDYWFAPGVGMVQQSAKISETSIVGVMSSYKLQD